MSAPRPSTLERLRVLRARAATRNLLEGLRYPWLWLKVDIPNFVRFGPGAPKAGQRIYINPGCVHNWVFLFSRRDTGKVIDGDWDNAVVPLTEIPKIRIVHRRIREGLSWQEAGAYDNLMQRIQDLGPRDGCSDLEDVKARYDRVDALIEHLAKGGRFLTSAEMGAYREFGGVYIHVGRNGEPIFGGGGCHRLAIAQGLGLERIPAQVGVVHRRAVTSGAFRSLMEARPAPGLSGTVQ